MTPCVLAVTLLVVAWLVARYWETIRINWIVWLTVNRGILTVNRTWWAINDWFPDSSGVELYQQLQRRGPFIRTTIFGHPVVIVTDIHAIRQIMDGSPDTFGAGQLKIAFFKPFMRHNVGVSGGCPWRRRRALNDCTLATPAQLNWLRLTAVPPNFDTLSDLGRLISTRVVFGEGAPVCPAVFNVFSEANSMWSVLGVRHSVDPDTLRASTAYTERYMREPIPGSLVAAAVGRCHGAGGSLTHTEVLHQIPHWVFPLNGLIAVAAPRLLVLLCNHPHVLRGLQTAADSTYMRHCILELFRLNNPVNSSFRTLCRDYTFQGAPASFPAGTEFLVLNNPVNRDPAKFVHPNRFIPERWTAALEASHYALMFNQGPQQCPGKELAIQVLGDFIWRVLGTVPRGAALCTNIAIDPDYVPQMINPVTAQFWVQDA